MTAGLGGLDGPQGLTWGPDGHLYVSSYNTDEILRYDGGTGAFIDVFVSGGSGGLDGPLDAQFRGGELLVVSARSDAVLRYDGASGAFLGELVSPGSGGLDYPHFMQIDDGVLYLAGKHGNDVLTYDADTGAFLGTLVAPGSAGLNGPRGLLILDDGPECSADIDGDGTVGVADLLGLLAAWGACP